MITGLDDWIGRIISAVEARGELDRTVIIFSSDHGEMLGDHDRWFKQLPHEGAIHVPLIVAGPGITAGVSDAANGGGVLAKIPAKAQSAYSRVPCSDRTDHPPGTGLPPVIYQNHLMIEPSRLQGLIESAAQFR